MRIERLRISVDFLEKLGFPDFFTRVSLVEITTAFQYDRNHFLSLARIAFKPGYEKDRALVLEQDLHVTFVQELAITESSIDCIIQSTSAGGFFPLPIPEQTSWAIVPPVTMTPESITFNLLAEESLLPKIHDIISSFGSEITVLALDDLRNELRGTRMLTPAFTDRQREITSYAVHHGFFKLPKQITAGQIAAHFNISISAVNEHLRKARQIALEYFFG